MRIRFSIRVLMTLVLFVGVGFAALRYATDLWASLVFTLTLGILATSVLGAAFRRGDSGAFYVGFALFGWGYMLLAFGPWADSAIRPRLVTTRLFNELYPLMRPASEQATIWETTGSVRVWDTTTGKSLSDMSFTTNGRSLTLPSPNGSFRIWRMASDQFLTIGHSLASLVAALLGGFIARFFYMTRASDPEGTP